MDACKTEVGKLKEEVKSDLHVEMEEKIKEEVANWIEEQKDRESRRLNLVVYGLKESDSDDIKTRKDEDGRQIREVIEIIDPDNECNIKGTNTCMFRIGGRLARKPRPLNITLENRN